MVRVETNGTLIAVLPRGGALFPGNTWEANGLPLLAACAVPARIAVKTSGGLRFVLELSRWARYAARRVAGILHFAWNAREAVRLALVLLVKTGIARLTN